MIMTIHPTAQSLDNLELTEQIKISFERDRFELAEAVATEVIKTVMVRFEDFLKCI